MLVSVQMKAKLKTLKDQAKELIASDDSSLEDINNIKAEIKTLEAKIEVQEGIEASEKADAQSSIKSGDSEPIDGEPGESEPSALYDKTFANYVRSKGHVSPEDKVVLEINNIVQEGTAADGGALVPIDDDTSIIKLREAGDALQSKITVKKVTTNTGKKTIRLRKGSSSSFAKVGEGAPIGEGSTPQYKKMEYSVDKYAAIYDITDEVIDDSDQNVIAEVNEWIGKDSRQNRNALILAELNKKAKTAITGVDDIKDIINVTLNTENSKYAEVITNQDGFNYLDKLKDSDGNYLLQKDAKDETKRTIKGRPVTVYDNSILPTVLTKAPVIIADMEMSVIMFDRQQVRIKITDVGGDSFENDKTLMRAIEREDVQTLDEDAFVYGEVVVS